MSLISSYISSIQREFDTGQSTEHSFRPALKTLLESLEPTILALNESQRIVGVGMPDFTIKDSKDNTINIGRIEAKDLRVDLDEGKNADQLGRYLGAFDNFIYTNNLSFQFYRQGKKVTTITLGTATKHAITWTGSESDFLHLQQHLADFLHYQGQTITSPEKLARAMAQKAQLLKYAIVTIFAQADRSQDMEGQYQTFKDQLVHDLTHEQFADMYAQTIVYGLFAARLYDPTLPNFSREEASKLIPKTNPLIRRLFKEILNSDTLDEALAHVIDDLINIFLHCNVLEILQHYGRSTDMQDPIIHFYETFLGEYDQSMRKKRGVYYTPQSVVQFIVRGVDHLLRQEFGLSMGLADTSMIEGSFDIQGKKVKQQVHRVQVLDPATGTGTFLHEVIRYIRETTFAGQEGMRQGYLVRDLLPRVWGFEILMASYTMAHLKIGMMVDPSALAGTSLSKGGFPQDEIPLLKGGRGDNERVNIYLTNSLEEPHDHVGSLFSAQLARESEQASKVKKEQPIMIVMGNPPYAVSSSNKGEWISSLIADYKKNLNEKKINLDDDYIKFIRYAQYFIDKNSEGIIAFITNNSYIDGITHRQMRLSLMQSFDSIYVYDLHGNSKKKESDPSGGKDENVFDIQQGVSMILAVKKKRIPSSKGACSLVPLATVYHYDSYGVRESKYQRLNQQTIDTVPRTTLAPHEPYYFFVPKDFGAKVKYDKGFKIDELFAQNSSGIETGKDSFVIFFNNNDRENLLNDLKTMGVEELSKKYLIDKEKVLQVMGDSKNIVNQDILYRPFDIRKTLYSPNSQGVMRRPRGKEMYSMTNENIGLIAKRGYTFDCPGGLVTKNIIDRRSWSCPGVQGADSIFPLYLYDEDGTKRKCNLNSKITAEIDQKISLPFKEKVFFFVDRHDAKKQEVINLSNEFDLLPCYFRVDGRFDQKNPEGDPFSWNTNKNTPYGSSNKSAYAELDLMVVGTCFEDIQIASYEGGYLDKNGEIQYAMGTIFKHSYANSDDLLNDYKQKFIDIFGTSKKINDNFKDFLILINVIFQKHYSSHFFQHTENSMITGGSLEGQKKLKILLTDDTSGLFSQQNRVKIKEVFDISIVQSKNLIETIEEQLKERENIIKTFFSPKDLFDYIYAVLHHPVYRETYKEFLKIDFPRIPYPTSKEQFWQLVNLGHELRLWHLMEHPDSTNLITSYPVGGDNVVRKVKYILTPAENVYPYPDPLLTVRRASSLGEGETGRVWINDTQYIDKVPQIAREFYIGGYQPAQKWLKDRKDKTLGFDEIRHYQMIIVALTRTAEVMEKLRGVEVV